MRKFFSLIAGVGFLFSCSSDTTVSDSDHIAGKDTASFPDSAHVFVMPTPLQVSTFLQTYAKDVHPEFLSDKSQPASIFSTDYQRGLNLGVCITDAGYAALYNNRQLTLDYLSRCEDLVKALRIEPAAAPYIARMRTNIDNKDSLSFLLLSLYNDVQKNLNEGQREKTAYYIMSGCYIESLTITLQYENLQGSKPYVQLLAQEKLWLDNIAEALTYLEPDSATQDLYSTFYTLQEFSKEITVSTGDDDKPTCTFTTEAFEKFATKSIQLRNEITSTKTV